jgi:hypothetical protein
MITSVSTEKFVGNINYNHPKAIHIYVVGEPDKPDVELTVTEAQELRDVLTLLVGQPR